MAVGNSALAEYLAINCKKHISWFQTA